MDKEWIRKQNELRKQWYEKYKIKIIKANTDKELDDIIDEIYSEGYEEGKNNPDYIERDYDDIRMDLD